MNDDYGLMILQNLGYLDYSVTKDARIYRHSASGNVILINDPKRHKADALIGFYRYNGQDTLWMTPATALAIAYKGGMIGDVWRVKEGGDIHSPALCDIELFRRKSLKK